MDTCVHEPARAHTHTQRGKSKGYGGLNAARRKQNKQFVAGGRTFVDNLKLGQLAQHLFTLGWVVVNFDRNALYIFPLADTRK